LVLAHCLGQVQNIGVIYSKGTLFVGDSDGFAGMNIGNRIVFLFNSQLKALGEWGETPATYTRAGGIQMG
jgi:hypothetical protein